LIVVSLLVGAARPRLPQR